MPEGYETPIKFKALIPSKEQLFNAWNRYEDARDKFLFAITYLSAGRIKEALNIKRKDFKLAKIKDRKVVVVRMINLKNRLTPEKEIPLIPIDSFDEQMISFIISYVKMFHKEQKIFSLSRNNAWNKLTKQHVTISSFGWKRYCRACNKPLVRYKRSYRCLEHGELSSEEYYTKKENIVMEKKINPHYLRHIRLTYLVSYKGINPFYLTYIAGWTSDAPAKDYVSRDWKSIARSLI